MTLCHDCERLFYDEEAVIRWVDQGDWFGFPSHEKVYCCPYCGSDNIEDWDEENVDTCVSCGVPIPEGRQVCPDCEHRKDVLG